LQDLAGLGSNLVDTANSLELSCVDWTDGLRDQRHTP
jgi:hypothetical protein